MMHGLAARAAIVSQLVVVIAGCAPAGNNGMQQASSASSTSTLTPEQRAAGWRPLFDGRTTAGWRGYQEQTMPAGWKVVDGTLTKSGSPGDIITKDQFGDFELALEWKLSPGGNAGIFFRGTEEYDHIYWSGSEYQLLDDALHADGKIRLTAAGAAYALYPSPRGIVKPADQWNSTLIVVQGPHVQHWMNGQKLLEYDLWSPDWEAKVKAGKFVEYPHYGRAKRGYIGIQGDHEGTLSLRDIRIRELK